MSTVALEYFVEAPEESYRETEEFINNVENFFRERTRDLERNLDKSNFSGGKLNLDNLKFWTKEERDVEDLIAKSLMVEYNTNWPDLKAGLRKKTEDYYGFDLENDGDIPSRKAEIIKNVYDFLEEEEDKIKDWIGSSRAGFYSPYTSSTFGDENGIVLEVIPLSLAEEIDGSHHILNPIYEKSVRDEESFNEILLHELNHAYLDNNSSIKDRDSRAQELDEAFNEIFAYYTSYVANDYKFDNKDSDLYSRPELIVWGVEILIEKSREFESRGKKSTGIDFERNLMEKIAQDEHPFAVFINACLLKEDKRRIKKVENILEDLQAPLSQLEEHLREIYENTDELLEKYAVEGIESSIKDIPDFSEVENTLIREIHYEMLEGDDAPHGDLGDINQLITRELASIAEKLEKLEKKLDEEKESFDKAEIEKTLTEMEKDISAHRKSMKEVITEGEVK